MQVCLKRSKHRRHPRDVQSAAPLRQCSTGPRPLAAMPSGLDTSKRAHGRSVRQADANHAIDSSAGWTDTHAYIYARMHARKLSHSVQARAAGEEDKLHHASLLQYCSTRRTIIEAVVRSGTLPSFYLSACHHSAFAWLLAETHALGTRSAQQAACE